MSDWEPLRHSVLSYPELTLAVSIAGAKARVDVIAYLKILGVGPAAIGGLAWEFFE